MKKVKYFLIFFITAVLICGVCVSYWFFPIIVEFLGKAIDVTDEKGFEEVKAYYEKLEKPKIDAEQAISLMQKQKGLYGVEPNLVKAVKWYVYHGKKDVIKQLISNLQWEIEVDFNGSELPGCISWKNQGCSYAILSDGWPGSFDWFEVNDEGGLLLPAVGPCLHQGLYQFAKRKEIDSQTIYILLDLIQKNEPVIRMVQNEYNQVRLRGNVDWFSRKSVCEDVHACLKIVEKSECLVRRISIFLKQYPFPWLDTVDIDEIVRLAKENGADYAFTAVEPVIRPAVIKPYDLAAKEILSYEGCSYHPTWCQSVSCGNWKPLTTLTKTFGTYHGDIETGLGYRFRASYCPKCLSIRLINRLNKTVRVISYENSGSKVCDHEWISGKHSWSQKK